MIIIKHFGNSNSSTWIRTLIIFVIWGILVYVFAKKLNTPVCLKQGKTLNQLNKALKKLNNTKQKNYELEKTIQNILNEKNAQNSLNIRVQPLLEYEQLRRRVRQNTQEMWNYFNSQLGIIRNNSATTNEMRFQIDSTLKLGAEHKRSLISDINQMRLVDGYELWRYQEADDLSNLLQRRLSYIQNPIDCKNAYKLVCYIDDDNGGYASELHHIVLCFIIAYITKRTMILESDGWIYNNDGWEEVFQPLSATCTKYEISETQDWPAAQDTKIIRFSQFQKSIHIPSYIPLGIPADLAQRLIKLHGDPYVWWMAQFFKYLLRPNLETQEMLKNGMENLGWKKPIVGIHIRRTDKIGAENAIFHTVEEYMNYVEEYYLTLDMNSTEKVERRVFLASDDPSVITEACTKYPQYKIIGAKIGNISTRYTYSSLKGIILDIHMLSLSDYLVCTMTSNVCRAAYELMQLYNPDASYRFKSLDENYFYIGQNQITHEAILSHKPHNKKEIYIKPGDLMKVGSNYWDGFSFGTNTRTKKIGLFPSFKIKQITKIDY